MRNDKLIVRREGAVAVVALNRPESRNALDTELMRRLVDSLEELAADEEVRAVVLTGSGTTFCPGGDLRAMSQAAKERAAAAAVGEVRTEAKPRSSFEKRVRWLRRSADASRLLHVMPKPTIAMVNGACAGAGMSLAAACDFRHAARSAVFRSAFVAGGMPGDYGGSWLWTRILGPAKARQLYLLDRKRDAEEALAFGLVDAVHDDAALSGAVMAMAHELAALPGAGVAYAKANLNAAMVEAFEPALDRESLSMLLARNAVPRPAKVPE